MMIILINGIDKHVLYKIILKVHQVPIYIYSYNQLGHMNGSHDDMLMRTWASKTWFSQEHDNIF